MIFLVVHSVQLLDHSPAILEDGRGGKSSNGSATRSKPGPVSELHFCTFVSGAVSLFWPNTVTCSAILFSAILQGRGEPDSK